MAKIYKNVSLRVIGKRLSEKIVLAYSGGLDTSVSIKWLQEKYNAEVVTLTLDLGQQDDLGEIAERAYALGVKNHHELDVKEEFVANYICPAIRANGLYGGKYPLATALGRPLIATKLVEIAEKEGATAVAHGCTGKGNDQVRIDVTVRALNPSLKVIAPVRDWNMSRDQEILYAKEKGIKIKSSSSIYSIDQNLWGRSIESGPLENPAEEPPNDAFEWVVPPEEAPNTPGYVELGFKDGIPTSVDGTETSTLELIKTVSRIAGGYGVGIVDQMEDRLVGIKSREVYEAPAATTIIEAHRELEHMVLTRHEIAFKERVEKEWAWLVYSGLWMEPLRFALDSFIRTTQRRVDGVIRLKLYKGGIRVVGRSSENSLYKLELSTYNKASTFDQRSAVGFIELWGLQSRLAAKLASDLTGRNRSEHPKREPRQKVK